MKSKLDRNKFSIICKKVVINSDLNTLTIRTLKDSLCKEMNLTTKEELEELESKEIENLIDSILLEEMQNPKDFKKGSPKTGTKKIRKPNDKKVDLQIKKLKKYISICGVKKIPLRGLEGTALKNHLTFYLKNDLGMEGQPSLDKCKQIRKKREWELEMKELNLMKEDSIIKDSKRRINKQS